METTKQNFAISGIGPCICATVSSVTSSAIYSAISSIMRMKSLHKERTHMNEREELGLSEDGMIFSTILNRMVGPVTIGKAREINYYNQDYRRLPANTKTRSLLYSGKGLEYIKTLYQVHYVRYKKVPKEVKNEFYENEKRAFKEFLISLEGHHGFDKLRSELPIIRKVLLKRYYPDDETYKKLFQNGRKSLSIEAEHYLYRITDDYINDLYPDG